MGFEIEDIVEKFAPGIAVVMGIMLVMQYFGGGIVNNSGFWSYDNGGTTKECKCIGFEKPMAILGTGGATTCIGLTRDCVCKIHTTDNLPEEVVPCSELTGI